MHDNVKNMTHADQISCCYMHNNTAMPWEVKRTCNPGG